jgi:hypothetical protein
LIYICIPTHNEQQTVGVVLWKLRQVLTEFPRDYQLLVADDASTDKTTDVLEPYTRVLPLTVIRSEHQQGWAASMEMLLREAVRRSEYPKRDVIITLQADFSEEPEDVVALIKRMEAGADVAVGVRVGAGKETRTRRFARSLARFFTRRESWPEGVGTPFDSYRAYRLYAVKRAVEDAQGRRIIRYDGWAGQAELLRAVLPHARRIEALDVEDRTDRMQRPRREKPLTAAWQVRAMASGSEPVGLVGVEDLDRTAATASRSRDRALSVANGRANRGGNGRRTSESRGGQERGERGGSSRGERTDRSRGQRGRSDRPERPERPERGERSGRAGGERTPREGGARRAPAGEAQPRQRKAADAGERATKRPARASRPEKPTEPLTAEALDELLGAAPADETNAVTTEGGDAAPKKRRRRRRSRGGGSTEGQTAEASAGGAAAAEANTEDGAEVQGEDGDDTPEGGEGAPKKRRRRGGRRGGRGRRRPGAEGSEGVEAMDGGETPTADSGSADDAVRVERVEPVAQPDAVARED